MVYNLREFASANERHPWDVRGKVGSERKFATSDNFANGRLGRDPCFYSRIPPAGPPKILYCYRGFSTQKDRGSILDLAPFLCSGACVAPSSFFMRLHAPILRGPLLRQNRAASVENEI